LRLLFVQTTPESQKTTPETTPEML